MVTVNECGSWMPANSKLCTMRLGVIAESGLIHASITSDDMTVSMHLYVTLILNSFLISIYQSRCRKRNSCGIYPKSPIPYVAGLCIQLSTG